MAINKGICHCYWHVHGEKYMCSVNIHDMIERDLTDIYDVTTGCVTCIKCNSWIFMSAELSVSWYGITLRRPCMYAYTSASTWTTSPPKLQGLETCCFSFKRYLIYRGWEIVQGMQMCLFVCLLETLQGRYPHQKCENFNTLSQFFQWLLQAFLSFLAYMY